MQKLSSRSLAPNFGMQISGIDFSKQLSKDEIAFIRNAWVEADGVLLFRNQDITPEDHVRLTSYFGGVYDLGATVNPALAHYYADGFPQIYRVSNKKVNGKALGREDAGTYWHSDSTWDPEQPRGSILHAKEIPSVGGDTMFANMYQAYEALSEPIKKMLEGLTAEHSLAVAVMKTSYAKEFSGKLDEAAKRRAVWPVIRTHPYSGRKALFVNPGFTSRILELSLAESDVVLEFLFKHSTSPEFVYRHTWGLHDVAMWDNYCNMHYAVANYKAHGDRFMHRTTVLPD
jgi:taurine dioxygenase